MAVQRLGVVPVERPDRPKQTGSQMQAVPSLPSPEMVQQFTPPPAPVAPNPIPPNNIILAQTLGVIAGIAGLTATRVLLLLAVLGAFYLATIAANTQSNASLYVLIAFAVLIVAPLVWLDSTKRGPG